MNAIHQDTDLWEVWIEFDQSHPEYFGTLYIHGEVPANKKIRSSFVKVDSKQQGQLHLRLPSRTEDFGYTKEVLYSEPIRNPNQYTSVSIYAGEELIGRFDEIEIMI